MPRVGRDSGSPDPDFNFLEHSITQHQELGEEVLITGTRKINHLLVENKQGKRSLCYESRKYKGDCLIRKYLGTNQTTKILVGVQCA